MPKEIKQYSQKENEKLEEEKELSDDLSWKDLSLVEKSLVIGFLLLCGLGVIGLSFLIQMI